MGFRIGGDIGPGEMDVARVYPYRSDQGSSSAPAHGLVGTPTVSGGHPIPGGGDSRPASYPVGDVHQTRIM